jgi:4-amino-4-deoxy-L-arabinose transferase-like glycosyltransferase
MRAPHSPSRFSWFSSGETKALMLVMIAGIVLRCTYFAATPVEVRGHDFDGHMEYVSYVLDHWTIPATQENWQSYQPPLYYFVSAAWLTAIDWGNRQEGWGYILQWGSLAFSILTFFIGLWIMRQLFRGKKDTFGYVSSSAFIAVFPSLIFFAPRANNDALLQVFAFLSIGLLIYWLRKKNLWILAALAISLGLGLLTKSNIAPIIIVSLACIFLARRNAVRLLARDCLTLVAIVGVLAAWLPAYRAMESEDSKQMIVGNYERLTNFVDNKAENLLVFNPLAMLRIPYNDPYSDAARRQYFWEYFYRSAFTGEFNFGVATVPYALLMIIFSLMFLPFILLEAVKDAQKLRIETSPLWIGIPVLLLSHWAFRFAFPYSSSQDFRYSIPLILAIAYFACRKSTIWSSASPIRQFACIGFIATATVFMLHVSLSIAS